MQDSQLPIVFAEKSHHNRRFQRKSITRGSTAGRTTRQVHCGSDQATLSISQNEAIGLLVTPVSFLLEATVLNE